MGTRKQWTGKEKPAIALPGLKSDRSVSGSCNDHGIMQGVYCKWRDPLLSDGAKLFERGGVDHARERLEHENRKLKAPRKAVTHKPRTVEPNRDWGIDMTKVMIPVFGWISLHVVIDWIEVFHGLFRAWHLPNSPLGYVTPDEYEKWFHATAAYECIGRRKSLSENEIFIF